MVLLDKTGEVAAALQELARLRDPATAAAAAYDGYLNGFYRSLKASRRGDEFAGRLEAVDSIRHLSELLFALDGRRAPYSKDLQRSCALRGSRRSCRSWSTS